MKRGIQILPWAPRIVTILAILFISLFALDSFSPGLTIWQQIGAFLIHLIPSFLLLVVLIIAWKREFLGGIILIFIGLGFSPLIFIHNYKMNHSVWISLAIILVITVPFIIAGILFIISHRRKKREVETDPA